MDADALAALSVKQLKALLDERGILYDGTSVESKAMAESFFMFKVER